MADPLDLVQLRPLMARSQGAREFAVGLIDGPVALDHAALALASVREMPGGAKASCSRAQSAACLHGTFVAGMLAAQRGSAAPSICPGCTLLLRPIFAESAGGDLDMPAAAPLELAQAIIACVNAGARVINLSAALVRGSAKGERELAAALDYAARYRVLVVAAAGNQATVTSSMITRHPWVIPVAGCDFRGGPSGASNMGRSIGARGLSAPCENITSLAANGAPQSLTGTSAAAPFVTGAIALLGSEFPGARPDELKLAVIQSARGARNSLVPPLLDAWAAYQSLRTLTA
ncbi:MAG: S8 family serine peptidase [Terriglobia bacterium]